jgi:hypothetical protein
MKSRAPHPAKRNYSLENILPANPFRARIYLPVQKIERCVDGQYGSECTGFLLSTDLQVGEQTAVRWIQRNVEPHFFSGVFEYRLSVLIRDSNTGWLDQHSLGIRQLKNRIAGFESHEKSIRLILTNNSLAKIKQFADVKTNFFRS